MICVCFLKIVLFYSVHGLNSCAKGGKTGKEALHQQITSIFWQVSKLTDKCGKCSNFGINVCFQPWRPLVPWPVMLRVWLCVWELYSAQTCSLWTLRFLQYRSTSRYRTQSASVQQYCMSCLLILNHIYFFLLPGVRELGAPEDRLLWERRVLSAVSKHEQSSTRDQRAPGKSRTHGISARVSRVSYWSPKLGGCRHLGLYKQVILESIAGLITDDTIMQGKCEENRKQD